jgi:hypothetical protein
MFESAPGSLSLGLQAWKVQRQYIASQRSFTAAREAQRQSGAYQHDIHDVKNYFGQTTDAAESVTSHCTTRICGTAAREAGWQHQGHHIGQVSKFWSQTTPWVRQMTAAMIISPNATNSSLDEDLGGQPRFSESKRRRHKTSKLPVNH